jgi:threonine/homoserine/homoserine lactone efflux protein
MRRVFWGMQALVAGAIVLNVVLSDFVKTGVATARDIPNALVIVVMLFLLWTNWKSQRAREEMVEEARAHRQKIWDEMKAEDAARDARYAAADAAFDAEIEQAKPPAG